MRPAKTVETMEIAPGLWRWTAPHPDWKEGDDWDQAVGCVYYEAQAATVLVDPLVPEPPERDRFYSALDRDVERRALPLAILLTVSWHARSSAELAERYDVGAVPPAGVEPFAVPEVDETLWWLPERGTLVAGDVLLGGNEGLRVCPDSWLDARSSPSSIRAALRPLLDLPIERILVSHGEPVLENGHAALEQALRA